MQTLPFPDLEYFLPLVDKDADNLHYIYEKTFSEAQYDPIVVLQTSGTTGIPKAVVMKHGTFACMDSYQLIPSLGGKRTSGDFWKGSTYFNAFPLFHTGCYLWLLGFSVFYEIPSVFPPAGSGPLTAKMIDLIHASGKVQGSILPPSFLVDLVQSSTSYQNLQRLRYIGYAGGPLAKEIGDKVTPITRLMTQIGSTESAIYPIELSDHEDWEYVKYSPFLGYEYRAWDDDSNVDDLYQLIIVRDEKCRQFQGVFSTFPELQEYATKDLYSRHPTEEGYWKFRGRTDDIIAFSNAEKFNPVDVEKIISAHPAVAAALVAGQGRFQASLLIEPRCNFTFGTQDETRKLLDEIWPTIEQANCDSPRPGRIMKDYVMFTTPDKPILRTGKGTIRRRMTIDMYHEEFNALYTTGTTYQGPPAVRAQEDVKVNTETSIRGFIHQYVANWAGKDHVDFNTDFFDLGFDSLQVTALVTQVNSFLREVRPEVALIENETLYAHPSIEKLASVLEYSRKDQQVSS